MTVSDEPVKAEGLKNLFIGVANTSIANMNQASVLFSTHDLIKFC